MTLIRNTAAEWASTDPVLADGVLGLDTTVRRIKRGDGVTAWTALPFMPDGAIPIAPLAFRNVIFGTDYGTPATATTVQEGLTQIGRRVSGGWYSVREFGAVGDGVVDDTVAIQAALDGAMGTLYFPPGVYNVSGSGDACLTLTRNVNIVGANGRHAYIRATAGTNTTSILRVSLSENWGFGNVRNWSFQNMSLEFTGDTTGLHALHIIDGGMPIITSDVTNCWLSGRGANNGHGIYIDAFFYYSKISQCTLTSAYMATHDANTIEKCLFNGPLEGVTFNLVNGVRNNTVRECCFLMHKDALRIIDGSNIRFLNNQCEQPDGSGVSTSPHASMVTIEGATRPASNTIISENNFGGGTNLNRLIYIDNAQQTVIEKNHMMSVGFSPTFNGKEIETTANAKYTVIRPDNFVFGLLSNPRTRTAFRFEALDAGEGTAGVLKDLTTANGWTGGDYFKDDAGTVHFWENLTPGTTTPGTTIGTLEAGFRPSVLTHLPVACAQGAGVVSVTTAGVVAVVSLPGSPTALTVPGFPSAATATP